MVLRRSDRRSRTRLVHPLGDLRVQRHVDGPQADHEDVVRRCVERLRVALAGGLRPRCRDHHGSGLHRAVHPRDRGHQRGSAIAGFAVFASDSDIYYDPFSVEIDKDPHPLWKRMRDEMPLYRNEKYTFWALTRYDDVEKGLVDWDNFRSGKGSTLEMILAGMEMPPGSILMEDPPAHDVHRSLMLRAFTPKAMLAIEPRVRAFCCCTLDPLMEEGRFDFITDLGAIMPMLTIGMLLGIPEEDQVAIRDRIDASLRIEGDGEEVPSAGW